MIIISAFPGTGKTYAYNKYKDKYNISDSDSSKFSWLPDKQRNPDFPINYISHIKNCDSDVIFVSSHKSVRDALVENKMNFLLIYPNIDLKEEYLQRFKDRNSSLGFLAVMEENFEKFIQECMNQKECTHVNLSSGEYISNYINLLLNLKEYYKC